MEVKGKHIGIGTLVAITVVIGTIQAWQWFQEDFKPHRDVIILAERQKTLEDYYLEDRAAREAVEQYQQRQYMPQQQQYHPQQRGYMNDSYPSRWEQDIPRREGYERDYFGRESY